MVRQPRADETATAGELAPEILARMDPLEAQEALGHEQVVFCHDAETGLRAIIAVHSTVLGPSLGGTRFHPFADEKLALADVLRLSRAMTFKSAAAGLDLGGGKAVIIGNPEHDRSEALLEAYGRFVDSLGGRYYTTEDVGTTVPDMEVISSVTPYVTGRAVERGGSGDPSPATAIGVFEAMRAAAAHLWDDPDLSGRHVSVSGVGKVGSALVGHLLDAGCRVTVADVDPERISALRAERADGADGADGAAGADGADGRVLEVVEPEKAHAVECDIFSPCALGAVLDPTTIPELQCAAVVGSANNQLASSDCADLLEEAGVLYVPDFVANAGGVVNIAFEIGRPYRWDEAEAAVRGIFGTTINVLETARREGITPPMAAERIAQHRIAERDRTGLPPARP